MHRSQVEAAGGAAARYGRCAIIAATLAISAVLLFARLGHHGLWDDEAITALNAQGVARTGDTSAVVGHNVVGWHDGALLHGLRSRHDPPLDAYVAALPVGLAGGGAWAARLPFALAGLACVGLLLRWAVKRGADALALGLLAIVLIGNVSYFLFFRQCRYYGLSILISVAIVYLYDSWDGRRRTLWACTLLSIALFASNYLNHVALQAALAVDYVRSGRKRTPLGRGDWLRLVAPQLLACGLIAWVWNPLSTPLYRVRRETWCTDRLTLLWWNARDLARCEFGPAILLLAAPVVGVVCGCRPLVRAWIALVAYLAAVTIISPQGIDPHGLADVRYLAPTIPLCIAIGVLTLRELGRRLGWLTLPLAGLLAWTSLVPGGRDTSDGMRSTLLAYLGELRDPPDDPFRASAAWINAHVPPGRSVWVVPEYLTCSLMYHAPGAVYAWQFLDPPRPDLAGLDPIHFRGRVPPDYIVVFGLKGDSLAELDRWSPKVPYDRVAVLDIYYDDEHRPELFLHAFRPRTRFNRATDGIYIFARRAAAAAGPSP